MLLALAANGYRRITCLLLAACGAGGLVLSGSRGAIVAFVAGLLVLLLRSKKVLRSMAIAVSIAICLWLIIPWDGTMFERTEESSYQSRMVLWAGAFTAFVQHPVAGIGSTNLAPTMSDYSDRELAHGHNVYLQILAENGVIGFVLFFAPLAYLIWRAMKTANDRVMLASSLALIVFLTHGVTDNVLMADNPPCLFLFFCVVGLSQASCVASNVSSITGLSQAPSLLCDDK